MKLSKNIMGLILAIYSLVMSMEVYLVTSYFTSTDCIEYIKKSEVNKVNNMLYINIGGVGNRDILIRTLVYSLQAMVVTITVMLVIRGVLVKKREYLKNEDIFESWSSNILIWVLTGIAYIVALIICDFEYRANIFMILAPCAVITQVIILILKWDKQEV